MIKQFTEQKIQKGKERENMNSFTSSQWNKN